MSKPFRSNDDFIVICKGIWVRFPTYEEAWEFYVEKKNELCYN